MTCKSGNFEPDWTETPPRPGSYRSIFKWGHPAGFKHPNKRLYAYLKKEFGLTDDDFRLKQKEGNETVVCAQPPMMDPAHANAIESIVGAENVEIDDYARVKYATGMTAEEAMRLREQTPGPIPDLVVHPRDKEDVRNIVSYCHRERIPIYPYSGGSSVTHGFQPVHGGITLVMKTHMNRVLELNETNQTVRVQPGILGPAYEAALNNAPEQFGAKRPYTGGHFPQSFEYASVGGWVLALGSGQQSTYYGDAYHLVVSQEYVTPAGCFVTRDYPATATGPKINDIMKGSEGAFGILVELTMKIYRHMPENQRDFAFIFPSWQAAVDASREITQGEFGLPSVLRISDPEETDIAMKLYGVEGTIIDKIIQLRGLKPMQRCLMIGHSEGEKTFSAHVKKMIRKICRSCGGTYITGYPVAKWRHGRYADPYMREDLHDYGIVTDTLESSVTWDNLHHLHQGVRAYVKSRPRTVCMTHASHFYPQGTNLYFIFISRFSDVADFIEFQHGIIDQIVAYGGSLSHHHGVGRMIGPWMEKHLGTEQMAVLRALKQHFDPNSIMNPGGGLLGLDGPAPSRENNS